MTTLEPGRLGDLLGVRYPIVQGPFGGGYSSVALAAEVANAGGLGSYGGHILTPDGLTTLVAELRAQTDGPFAVNLWVPQPSERDAHWTQADIDRLRPHYDKLGVPAPEAPPASPAYADQAEALLAAGPPAMSFVMGIPAPGILAEARRRGIVTIGTATTVDEALAIEAAGMDAVVASGSDAGGHRGSFLRPVRESLVGTFSLVPQVADAVGIPVIAAGGIADGRGVAAALTLGADAVQVGTGFLATAESNASDVHRAALHSADARVTVLTRLFSGRLARGIVNDFIRDMAAHEDDVPAYPVQNNLMLPIRQAAGARNQPGHVNLWAGQAAALSRPGHAAEYLRELAAETEKVLAGRRSR
ncbi:NAD(P)H-dependent flavin oxidoreductase [Longispora albida]|uniref:NAD(P)H-dependent flavin oxidoreductase n=1 Tax=Longispora albida TaxID=203523 RepID=UPI00036A1E5C|nr:nitronate monooxygenase [Longispora albida]